MKKFITILIIFSFLFLPVLTLATNFSGDRKWSWGENVGWLNFQPTNEGVTVADAGLTGYVWAENVGWIKFDHSQSSYTPQTSWSPAAAGGPGMESTNYKIGFSSINVGGSDVQVSTPGGYKMADTIGEVGTGVSTSSGYKLNAGYRQMQEVYIAITVPTEGLTMNQPGNMSIIVNQVTNAVAGAVWNVKTDAPAGYTLSFSAEQTNCLRKDGSAYFTDYSEVSEGTPEAWSADNSSYQFGFSVFGNDAPDGTWGIGSSCLSPASNNLKYRGFDSTNNIQVASSSSSTSGTDTAFCAAAEQKDVFAPNGVYTATVTATAISQ